jgi:hypothetical protein
MRSSGLLYEAWPVRLILQRHRCAARAQTLCRYRCLSSVQTPELLPPSLNIITASLGHFRIRAAR